MLDGHAEAGHKHEQNPSSERKGGPDVGLFRLASDVGGILVHRLTEHKEESDENGCRNERQPPYILGWHRQIRLYAFDGDNHPGRSPENGCDVVEYGSIHKISFRFQKTTK